MGPQAAPMGPDPLAEMRLRRRVVLSVQQQQPAHRLGNADQPGLRRLVQDQAEPQPQALARDAMPVGHCPQCCSPGQSRAMPIPMAALTSLLRLQQHVNRRCPADHSQQHQAMPGREHLHSCRTQLCRTTERDPRHGSLLAALK